MTSLSPWHVTAQDFRAFRGYGGQTFTELVDALVRAEAAVKGLRPDQVVTNLRVNVSDGGVDTAVKEPLGGPFQMAAASCWQYKATDFADVTDGELVREINKPEAKARVLEGYQYCCCICDDSTVDRQNERRAALLSAAREINPNAPAPLFLTAGLLAEWANRFPSVVVRFFRPQLGMALAYDAWLRKERATLPKYIPIPARSEAATRIAAHGDFTKKQRVALLLVAGPAGTGKSRLVAEALAAVAPLTLFVDASSALTIATSLINEPAAMAVFVVDGSDAHTRAKLGQLLKGSEHRLRAVIVCDAADEQPPGAITLAPLEEADVQGVLEANFKNVYYSHRRAFAHLADGVLQVAASLASAYESDPSRWVVDAMDDAGELLGRLVRDDDDRRLLEALAMFHRVGHTRQVEAQFEHVCRLSAVDREQAIRRLRRIASNQGLAVFSPRYVAVRPRLFARPLFDRAWQSWVGDNIERFVAELSAELVRSFLKQAAAHASPTVRNRIATWAQPWLNSLRPNSLTNSSSVERLLMLVDVNPVRVGAQLVRLVREASDEELVAAGGQRLDGHSCRLHLTWCLQNLLGRSETYASAEEALFRFAQTEGDTETAARQSSSATAKWSSSFRILLSGTEVAFAERFTRLSSRVAANTSAMPFAVSAIDFVLNSHAWKSEGSPLVAGNIRPKDWQPRTYGEYADCFARALALLERCIQNGKTRAWAMRVLARHGRAVLRNGMLDALRPLTTDVVEAERVAILAFVDDFLRYDCDPKKNGQDDKPKESDRYPDAYIESVRAWRESLRRSDLRGRLVEALWSSHWFEDDGGSWKHDTEALAVEFSTQHDQLIAALPWLLSCDGNGSAILLFGQTLGREDRGGELVNAIFDAAAVASNPLFLRGYLLGLHRSHPQHDASVLARLSKLEEANASLAIDLSEMLPDIAEPGARAIRLVRAHRIEPGILKRMFALRADHLGDGLEVILDILAPVRADALPLRRELLALEASAEARQEADNRERGAAYALELLGAIAWDPKTALPSDQRTIELMWRTLETALAGAHAQSHSWGRILSRLATLDFTRSVRLVCRAVLEADLSIEEEAAKELSIFIGKDPRACIAVLGPMILALESPWMFGGRRGAVINAFPTEMLQAWIVENGVAAARVVASHLSLPKRGPDGALVVSTLTTFVLTQFEDDDEVFAQFAHGRHNGQLYSGDIAGQHEAEAAQAEAFMSHPLRRVREWAALEFANARESAQWAREREEDFDD